MNPLIRRALAYYWKVYTRGPVHIRRALDARRFLYGSIGEGTIISPKSEVNSPGNLWLGSQIIVEDYSALLMQNAQIKIGNRTMIWPFARIHALLGDIIIGEDCTLNHFSMIVGERAGIRIGDGVRIGAHSLIIGSNHVTDSTKLPIWKQGISSKGITIEDDVWIGSNVTVLDGVRVCKGSILAAGSVVTEDVPEFTIVGGVPARVIKNRE